MQQTGCLKKRRRRNLAKVCYRFFLYGVPLVFLTSISKISQVTGLGLKPYDEETDTYQGHDIYTYDPPTSLADHFKTSSSRFFNARNSSGGLSSRHRVTRDPGFTLPEVEDNFDYNDGSLGDYYEEEDVELGYGHSRRPGSTFVDATRKSQEALDRPYLLDSTVMARLKQLVLLGKTSGAFPWSWNKKEHRIDRWSPTWERVWVAIWAFVTIQTLLLTMFQFYSFYSRVKGEIKTYREIFMMSLSMYWYICAVYFNINMYLYKDIIRQYINTMFALNKDLCGMLHVHHSIFLHHPLTCEIPLIL